jgi:hypothetical protein
MVIGIKGESVIGIGENPQSVAEVTLEVVVTPLTPVD